MKKNKQAISNLLSEELDSNILMHLKGGTNGNTAGIASFPHDLVTPSIAGEPYTQDDPNEPDKPGPV